ncbi:hydantoinase/carbamoylase family amidase [Acuticoccus sp. M5D2P5]|uniref:hydantoinase/carbamoylase family amidase n=1 Tax=Acuticoccus kalidii TaxID=2910977 RepID=UPI001F47C42C|nr:hydantoinase/carbamoylase family amidase [Acuticoccus kalidii]MCF3933867.1 hydantoinase/carbamoylase family amidase [Acuticoccus kalidii]
MIKIDAGRLLGDLRRLAEFGKYETGVDRIAFSDDDIAARRWLAGRMEEVGLSPEFDRYGTVLGRSRKPGKAILIGSHTDTVPRGGWLDGAMGVIYGLEVARALDEAGADAAVDVISFQDEEGSFVPCLGSKAFCGLLDAEELARGARADGLALSDVLPVDGMPERDIRVDPERHAAFLEAHIEQGPRLETAGLDLGIVSGIVGIRRFRITAMGEANHAGTTPMDMRKDAGASLLRLAAHLLDSLPQWGSRESVWNIGAIEFSPGAPNVVPAEASLVFEFRDLSNMVIADVEEALAEAVAAREAADPVRYRMVSMGKVDPLEMDEGLRAVFTATAERLGYSSMVLPSGAGHDAMILGRRIPAMMMFVPSIGGRSHDITENTADADLVRGCEYLANVTAEIAKTLAR